MARTTGRRRRCARSPHRPARPRAGISRPSLRRQPIGGCDRQPESLEAAVLLRGSHRRLSVGLPVAAPVLALVADAVRPGVDAPTVPLAAPVLALVTVAVRPRVDAPAVHLAVPVLALVAVVGRLSVLQPLQRAATIRQAIRARA